RPAFQGRAADASGELVSNGPWVAGRRWQRVLRTHTGRAGSTPRDGRFPDVRHDSSGRPARGRPAEAFRPEPPVPNPGFKGVLDVPSGIRRTCVGWGKPQPTGSRATAPERVTPRGNPRRPAAR